MTWQQPWGLPVALSASRSFYAGQKFPFSLLPVRSWKMGTSVCFGLDQCLVHNKDSIIVKWSILQEMWTTFLVNKAWFSPTTQFHINSLEWKTIVILCRFTPTSTLHSLCSQIPKCFAPTLISKSGKNRKSTENTRTAFLRVLPRQRQTHGKEQDGTMELTLPMNQTNSNQLLT